MCAIIYTQNVCKEDNGYGKDNGRGKEEKAY